MVHQSLFKLSYLVGNLRLWWFLMNHINAKTWLLTEWGHLNIFSCETTCHMSYQFRVFGCWSIFICAWRLSLEILRNSSVRLINFWIKNLPIFTLSMNQFFIKNNYFWLNDWSVCWTLPLNINKVTRNLLFI